MRILKFLISILVVLFGIFIVGGFLIPSEWMVSRSVVIHAHAEQIYPYVSHFKEWEKWSPWSSRKDVTLHYVYEGPESGAGSKQSWKSDTMGSGWMKLTSADPQSGVAYDLFIDMGQSQSTLHGTIHFTPEGGDTKVTWTDKGDAGTNFVKRWLSLVIKFMIGKEFNTGLADLKVLVEQSKK